MPDYKPLTFDEILSKVTEVTLQDGYHRPMLWAVGSQHLMIVQIMDMPEFQEERTAALYVIGYEVSRAPIGKLVRSVLITEAWLGNRMDIRPSEDPERVEVLVLSHYAMKERRLELVAYQMIRDNADKLIDLAAHWDTRQSPAIKPVSALMDGFLAGYHDGRKGRMPKVNIPRG